MRPDGTRVKNLPPLVAAIPYIMPKRYDAWNTITENIDEEVIKEFIRDQRRQGVRLNHMSVIISAYYKASLENPKLNYFVMNRKIYKRNHFCVSFVIMKKKAGGRLPQRNRAEGLSGAGGHGVYREREDQASYRRQRKTEQSNSTDHFARFMFSVPGLPRFCGGPGLFPGQARGCCPGRSSTSPLPHQPVYHQPGLHQDQLHPPPLLRIRHHQRVRVHGQAVPNYMAGDLSRKMMPLGIVMDERICTGYEYAAFCHDFRRIIRKPEVLTAPFNTRCDGCDGAVIRAGRQQLRQITRGVQNPS